MPSELKSDPPPKKNALKKVYKPRAYIWDVTVFNLTGL